MCKARIDKTGRVESVVADLKTTEDASAGGFARSYAKYGYHRQLAFYGDGFAEALGCDFPKCVIIAAEKSPPHGVALYVADTQSLDVGRQEYRRVLAEWAVSCFDNKFSGYGDEAQPISLPFWALPQEDE